MMSAVDPSLEDRVFTAIHSNPYLPRQKRLRFESTDGRIVLKGTVSSYFQKQMAQEALRSIDGVTEIDNRLEVEWRRETPAALADWGM